MLKTREYVPALFWSHLMLEKLLKAHWVKDNVGNHPPKIHNLVRLAEKTRLQITVGEMDFLRRMNDFQLEGRYPDYQHKLYSVYKSKNTLAIINTVSLIRKWLLKKLQ